MGWGGAGGGVDRQAKRCVQVVDIIVDINQLGPRFRFSVYISSKFDVRSVYISSKFDVRKEYGLD